MTKERRYLSLTRALKSATSSSVMVSALAMTGIKLTLVCKRRMNSISSGLRLSVAGQCAVSRRKQVSRLDLRVTGRLDEVQACVYAVVGDLGPVDAVLLLEIRVEASFDVLDNRFPAGHRAQASVS